MLFALSAGCGGLQPPGGRKVDNARTKVAAASGDATGTPASPAAACTVASGTPAPSVSAYQMLAAPILTRACAACHSGAKAPNLAGEANATANKSLIVDSVTKARMPPSGSLSQADIAALQQWASAPALALAASPATYEVDIKPMIDAKCAWCHSAAAKPSNRQTPYMTNYTLVKQYAATILTHMKGTGGAPMPPQGALPALVSTDVPLFQAWIAGGYVQGTPPPPIDTTKSIYYVTAIQNLLTANCVTCHAAGLQAPNLSTYQAAADGSARSLVRIQQGTMPPSLALAPNLQTAFGQWVSAGTPYDGSGSVPPTPAPAPAPSPVPAPAPALPGTAAPTTAAPASSCTP